MGATFSQEGFIYRATERERTLLAEWVASQEVSTLIDGLDVSIPAQGILELPKGQLATISVVWVKSRETSARFTVQLERGSQHIITFDCTDSILLTGVNLTRVVIIAATGAKIDYIIGG